MAAAEKHQIFTTKHVSIDYVLELRDGIESFEDYVDVFKMLNTITDKDTLEVRLNTPGGDCSVGWALIDAIQSVPCPVHCIVTYPTYSMGALLAVCGDMLTICDDTYIMFHDFSSGMKGKGGDMALYLNNYREVFVKRFNKLCQPFLSKKESRDMFNGLDIYIHDSCPTLATRIDRHFKRK